MSSRFLFSFIHNPFALDDAIIKPLKWIINPRDYISFNSSCWRRQNKIFNKSNKSETTPKYMYNCREIARFSKDKGNNFPQVFVGWNICYKISIRSQSCVINFAFNWMSSSNCSERTEVIQTDIFRDVNLNGKLSIFIANVLAVFFSSSYSAFSILHQDFFLFGSLQDRKTRFNIHRYFFNIPRFYFFFVEMKYSSKEIRRKIIYWSCEVTKKMKTKSINI